MTAAGAVTGGPELRLLGTFRLRYGQREVPLPSSAERLLAYLALQDGPVRRAQVANVLWLDSTDERSAASLRSALWRLRQPGLPVVSTTTTHVGIAPEVRIDLRDGTAAARSLVSGSDGVDGDVVERLDEDLLPGWYEDDWLVVSRERWRHLRLHALEALATLLARRGRYAEAVDAAYAAIRGEPLRESAHRCLIAVHLAEGNRNEALRQYDVFRRMLDDELGVEPSPQITAMVAALTPR